MSGTEPRGRRLRVLFLYPGPRWSVEHEFQNRIEALDKEMDVTFVTSTIEPMTIEIGRSSIRTFSYKNRFGGGMSNPLLKLIYYLRFARFANQVAADMARSGGGLDGIVSYDPLGTGLVALHVARKRKVKLITEVNGLIADAIHYKDAMLGAGTKRAFNVNVAEFILNRSDGIKYVFDGQGEPYRLNDRPTLAMPNHTEASHFYTAPGEKIVLAVGAPFFVKGFDFLVEAFVSIADQFPDWSLKIIGYFEDEPEVATRYGDIHPRVEIAPPVMHADLPHEMARASIFAAPSRTEGVPRVLIESMVAGKARIGTRVGGIPTVINHEIDGLLVDAGDIAGLATALRTLMHDPGYLKKISDAALQRYHDQFTLQNYVARYTRFIGDVITG